MWTTLGTILCVTITLGIDSFNFMRLDESNRLRAILLDVFLPIGFSVPVLLFFTTKLRELAVAHHELAQVAATDGLTSMLNRRAFVALVEAYLAEVRGEERRGALLVVDADNFKSINDRFGHDRGDEALKVIARAIKAMLRSADLVGRIGGEEFAVFLPGSGADQAVLVAERIRRTVAESDFAPAGSRILSVSVGGAVFEQRLPFAELFRLADQQLYAAKNNGRNRISVAPVTQYEAMPMAAA